MKNDRRNNYNVYYMGHLEMNDLSIKNNIILQNIHLVLVKIYNLNKLNKNNNSNNNLMSLLFFFLFFFLLQSPTISKTQAICTKTIIMYYTVCEN